MGVGIFISHSSADNADALALDEALRHPRGLAPESVEGETWLDKFDILAGRDYASEIVAGQRRCQVAVFLLSDAALASAEFLREWDLAKKMGLTILPFMTERERQLTQLPDGWNYELLRRQAKPWEGAVQTAAEIYLTLGLPTPHCPCGKPIPYERCHARWRPATLPETVPLAHVLKRGSVGAIPLGILEEGALLTFDPDVDRHLQCAGPPGSGKTNLASVVLRGAARYLPLHDRFLISARADQRLMPANLAAVARVPHEYPRVVEGVLAAVDEQRPCLLVIDDLHVLPLRDLEPLSSIIDGDQLHVVVTRAVDYQVPERSLVGQALEPRHLRVQLQEGAVEFGRPAKQWSATGRATVWRRSWQGPRSAQLANVMEEW